MLVVDDHEMVRVGLRMLLQVAPDMEAVGEAEDGETGVRLALTEHPDVVLLDMVLPGMDGPAAAKAILEKAPGTRIIALTSFPEGDLIQRALEAGVEGYLLKNVGAAELTAAIRAAVAGRPTLAPEAARAIMQRATRQELAVNVLSEREREVLVLMSRGMTNRAIAEELVISPSTAGFHVGNILGKLGVATRTEAVALAMQRRILD